MNTRDYEPLSDTWMRARGNELADIWVKAGARLWQYQGQSDELWKIADIARTAVNLGVTLWPKWEKKRTPKVVQ